MSLPYSIELLLSLDYSTRLLLVLGYSVCISFWLQHIVKPCPPGSQRLLWASPVLLLNLLQPLIFPVQEELVSRVVTAFVFIWLTEFKALGLVLDRGPLCLPLYPVQFWAVCMLPITPLYEHVGLSLSLMGHCTLGKPSKKMDAVSDVSLVAGANPAAEGSNGPLASSTTVSQQAAQRLDVSEPRYRLVPAGGKLEVDGGSSSKLLLAFTAKVAILGSNVYLLGRNDLPLLAKELLYAVGLYAFLGVMMHGLASVAVGGIGLKISPHFDSPFMATSISDFWRRWNITAANTLRFLIYDPICQGSLVRREGVTLKRSRARQAVGMMTAFAVSGLVHEVIYFYVMRHVTGYWLAFFSMQGPVMVVEAACKRWMKHHGIPGIPRAAATALTFVVAMALAHAAFFPPCTQYGDPPLADQVVMSVRASYDVLLHGQLRALVFR